MGCSRPRLLLLESTCFRALGLLELHFPGSRAGGQAQQLWHTGFIALWQEGSSQIRDRTHVSFTGRRILYYWPTTEAQLGFYRLHTYVKSYIYVSSSVQNYLVFSYSPSALRYPGRVNTMKASLFIPCIQVQENENPGHAVAFSQKGKDGYLSKRALERAFQFTSYHLLFCYVRYSLSCVWFFATPGTAAWQALVCGVTKSQCNWATDACPHTSVCSMILFL